MTFIDFSSLDKLRSSGNQWWEEAGKPTREQVPLVYDAQGVLSQDTIAKQEVAGHNTYFNSHMTDGTNMDSFQNQIVQRYQQQSNPNYQLPAERTAAAQANQQDMESRQAADRAGGGGFLGLGDFGTIAALGLGAYGLGSLGGLWGGAGSLGDSAAMAALEGTGGMWGAPAAEAAGGWGVNAATGGGMDWFEQLMQNYNPDLGFQGLNEAGSGALAGGLGTPTGFEDIPFGTTYPDYIDPKFTGGFSLPNLPGGTGNMLSQLLGNSGAIGAALGAGAGALGGGQKPAGSITTIQDVPDWLKPYVMANLQGV